MTVTQISQRFILRLREVVPSGWRFETNGGRREEVARQRMIVKASCAARDPEMPLQ